MRQFWVVYTLAWLIFLFFLSQSISADEGHIGFTYSQIIDDRSAGATGTYQADLSDRIGFDANATLQAGDIYNLKVNTDFTIDIATVDLKLLIENKVKGYTLDTLGRSNTIGLAFTAPVNQLNIDVGIGGANSSPFGSPNAYDTLVAEGFSETALQGKGLASISAPSQGLPFKDGNTVNAFIATSFPFGGFDTDLKGIIELLGEGEKQHQAHLNFKRKGQLGNVALTMALELGMMRYGDAIHYETALITSMGFDF